MWDEVPIPYERPLHVTTAKAAVCAFIEHCQGEFSYVYGSIDWESYFWGKPFSLNFCDLRQKGRIGNPDYAFPEPYMSYAKAWVFYQKSFRRGTKTASKIIPMLKCLHQALVDQERQVWQVDESTMDVAQDVVRRRYKKTTAYGIGKELEIAHEFLVSKCLVRGSFVWRSALKADRDRGRVSLEAKKKEKENLPDPELVKKIGQVFSSCPTNPRDIITTSLCAIMLPLPVRIGEVLNLPVECLVEDKLQDGRPALGVRFHVEKNGIPKVKHVQPEMAPIIREAVSRLRALGEEARRIAKFHEENPGKFYRHRGCPEVTDHQPLSYQQVAAAMGWAEGSDRHVRAMLYNAKLSTQEYTLTLSELGNYVYKRLPADFPWIDRSAGIRYSEGLFCIQRFLMHSGRTTSPVLVSRVSPAMVANDLGEPSSPDGSGFTPFFARHPPEDSDVERHKIRAGQFRHQITTMALRGMLSAEEIAWWSGRKNISENSHYQHVCPEDMASLIRARDSSLEIDQSVQALVDRLSKQIPLSEDSFLGREGRTGHVTEFGFCTHDFVMAPCFKAMDCLNCSEQVCVKGDSRLDVLTLIQY